MHAWLVQHPPHDQHPGAVLVFTDPTLDIADPTPPFPMPCWVIGCGCDLTLQPALVFLDEAAAALHDTDKNTDSRAPERAGQPHSAGAAGTDHNRQTGAQGRSGRIDGGSRVDAGSS